ncbi:hypothetical protein EDB85DRAFT_1924282 [Lactarius pseudohatsudake]|nr:hypothetical protein EDB85DRAFT_1924282 [Lactarius pseudohatsudake]
MQEPFPALTNLRLWSADLGATVPIIPQGFLGESTRLQKITLGSISFPTLPKLLLSCGDLINLQLMEIPKSGYISPEGMVAGLSSLSRLKTFEIGFSSLRSCSGRRLPPPSTRSTISTLTEFTFKGSGLGSPDNATLFSNEIAVSLRLWRVGRSTGSPIVRSFSLNILYLDIDRQISSVAQICLQSLPLLSGVKRLSIDSTDEQACWQGDMRPEWRRFLCPFTAVEKLYVSAPLRSQIDLSLTGQAEMLPALRSISLKRPRGPEIVLPSPPGSPISP